MNQASIQRSTQQQGMREYVATRQFVLGSTNVTLTNGMSVLFDGVTIEVDGIQHRVPTIRGAIRARWLVPLDEYDPNDPSYSRGVRAEIQVRSAKGGNPLDPPQRSQIITTESDERSVRNVREHADQTATNNRGSVRQTVSGLQTGQLVKTQRGMMQIEAQDGVELDRQMTTPSGQRAKDERIDLTTDKAVQAMRIAREVSVRPGTGVSEDEMLARMTPEESETYLAQKEAHRSRYVPDSPGPTQSLPRPRETRVVARVQSASSGYSEGMAFKNSVGGGVSIGDSTDGEVVGRVHSDSHEVIEQEGITFKGTNLHARRDPPREEAPRAPIRMTPSASPPPPMPANTDVRRRIAKTMCSEFPDNYDFTVSPKKKLARLQADYEDRQDVLHAVYAAESDDMKALLVQEFPTAFSQ